jgi:hypothetical protein
MNEGNIQAARTRLKHAVDRLCAQNHTQHHHRTLTAPSLYDQLCSDIAGTQGENKTPAKSLPLIWIDAAQLKQTIDTQTAKWLKRPKDIGTPQRLNALAEQTWRPQDTKHVTDIGNTVDRWATSILNLLNPQSVKHITAPCPSCNRKTVYRKDDTGEVVRQPALRIVTNQGCTCLHCDAHWAPDKYMFLCTLLGFDLPEGVLE